MAEREFMAEPLPSNVILLDVANTSEASENNIIHGNFQPDINRREVMRRIGEIAAAVAFWHAGEGGILYETVLQTGDILSSVPIRKEENKRGDITVLFKQYRLGFRGDGLGMYHWGYRGNETISVLKVRGNTQSKEVDQGYIEAKNFRYIFPNYEVAKQRAGFLDEMAALREELWSSKAAEVHPMTTQSMAAD